MAVAVVTMKLMPTGPDVDLDAMQGIVKEKVSAFTGDDGELRFELVPVAFGLKALDVKFVMDESLGSPDDLETTLSDLEGVQSANVTDVRRALG